MDDHELLEDFIRHGSQASFDALVHRYSGLVLGVCSRSLPDAAAAEDAVQATFIVLMRKASQVARTLDGRPLAGWLHVTAHRAALQMRRSLVRRRRHEQAAAATQRTLAHAQAEPDLQELRSWLDGALALLSASQRESILLRFAQGMSQEEAADVMGCSRETVHTHVTRGLMKLRQRMRRQGLAGSASVIPVVLGESSKVPLPSHLVSAVHSACFHPHTSSPAWTAASQVMSHASSVSLVMAASVISAVVALALVAYPHIARDRPAMGALPAIQPAEISPLLEYRGHQGGVVGVVFSRDGTIIASSSWDNSVQSWTTEDGRTLQRQTHHTSGVHALAGSASQGLLVTAGSDGQAIIWAWQPVRALVTLNPHDGRLLSAAVSGDGGRIATGALDGTVRLWSTAGAQTSSLHIGYGGVWGLAFSPDGMTVVTAGDDHLVRSWEASTGRHLGDFSGHTDCLRAVAFSGDGTRLVSGGNDGTVRIWRVSERTLERTILVPSWPQAVAFSPDGALIATAGDSGAQLWDVDSGAPKGSASGATLCVAFSPDGHLLAAGGRDGVVRLWRVSDLTTQATSGRQQ